MPIVGGKSQYRTLTKWEKEELWIGYNARAQVEQERYNKPTDKPLENIEAEDIRREWEKQAANPID
jgi:hypothetical protein